MATLENIHGIPARIAALKAKLKARDGKKEFADNVKDIRAEITRLEALTQQPGAVASE
jgi:hypothetical protein